MYFKSFLITQTLNFFLQLNNQKDQMLISEIKC